LPLFLNNHDQERSITVKEATDAIADGLRQFANGDAVRRPRIDNFLPTSRPDEFFCFSSMEGGVREPGYYALRIKPDILAWPIVDGKERRISYSFKPGLFGGLVLLYRVDNAEFLAIMNDGVVQHIRVAATAALGSRYLAREDSQVVGVIGSGGMARDFAVGAVNERPIQRIQAYSPNRDHLETYCNEMSERLGCQVVPMKSAEAATRGADILALCTNSQDPVIEPDWIKPGMHLTNVRSPELSPAGYARIEVAGLLARRTPMSIGGYVDDDFSIRGDVMAYTAGQPDERARIPAGAPSKNRYPNARYVDCCNWQTSEPYRRERPDEITILTTNSMGTLEGDAGASSGIQGIQFAAVAGKIYENARATGLGTELPQDMFLQDIPT
jgi:ornithine cyclodeaminase/alanine dehydrogenase-like protein (mu-crystallin family)